MAARWGARLLTGVFAALVAAGLVVTVVLPRATHGVAMTVLSGSMEPSIPVGSVVLVRPVDPLTLEAGDVATYQPRPGEKVYVTHRVVEVDTSTSPTSFVFQGDANRTPDADPVIADQIHGEVWFHVPYLGTVRDALHGRGGITLVLTLLLAAYALSQLGGGLRERRERRAGIRDLRVGRRVVLVDLDDPTTAADVAESWGGLVVDGDHAGASVLIAPPPDHLDRTVARLRDAGVGTVSVSDASTTLRLTVTAHAAAHEEADRVPA